MKRRDGPAIRDTILLFAEILATRPADAARPLITVFGVFEFIGNVRVTRQRIAGCMPDTVKSFVPENKRGKAFLITRIWGLIYLGVAAQAVGMRSILPFMVIGLPIFYGSWRMVMTGVMQHLGLAENAPDHRLNSRTVCINPVSRFIYGNMTYHVEHHMFPRVPYHARPGPHAVRHDMPPTHPSILPACAEIIPALCQQFRNPDGFVKRRLPATAKPCRPGFHGGLEPWPAHPSISGYPARLAAE